MSPRRLSAVVTPPSDSGEQLAAEMREVELLRSHLDSLEIATDAEGRAWVGFAAATGIASIDTDLLSFAFCQHPGCDAA